MKKKTVVIGASDNPSRYSYIAAKRLQQHGHEVVAVGLVNSSIGDIPITRDLTPVKGVDTVTLYVGPKNQPYWYDYIFALKPKRIIFNPGTESAELENMARERGIETVEGCTLVMLGVGTY